jgi:histidinol phosphatase-like enzyme
LLLRAAQEMGLDLPASALIGDSLSDVQAALAAGVQPLLLRRNQRQAFPEGQDGLLERCWLGRDLSAAAEAFLRVFHHGKPPSAVVYYKSV